MTCIEEEPSFLFRLEIVELDFFLSFFYILATGDNEHYMLIKFF